MVEPGDQNKIVTMRFNQDQSCFVCGTEKGFQIHNTHPYKDTFDRVCDGGLGVVEMLFKSNILALVGGGTHPKYPLNKVMLWDDNQTKCIGELSFKTPVKSVKMRKDKIVIVLEARIYVYNFTDLRLIEAVDTYKNERGVCAVSVKEQAILVCPSKTKGEVYIHNYETQECFNENAHKNALAVIELNSDGTLCATASDKGTLIRVFRTKDRVKIKELRRGKDKADIQSIAFDHESRLLACTSDKGTVHIFSLGGVDAKGVQVTGPGEGVPQPMPEEATAPEEKKTDQKNPTSAFKFMKGIVPYFSSEWSLYQLHTQEKHILAAFSPEESNRIIGISMPYYIVVVSYAGKYILAEFDPTGKGECKKIEERQITLAP
jgi:WD40 repeat protein